MERLGISLSLCHNSSFVINDEMSVLMSWLGCCLVMVDLGWAGAVPTSALESLPRSFSLFFTASVLLHLSSWLSLPSLVDGVSGSSGLSCYAPFSDS